MTGTVMSAGTGGESLVVSAAAVAAASLLGDRPPRWHNDPTHRHDMRYWDGTAWTRFVFEPRRARSTDGSERPASDVRSRDYST